MSWQPTNHVEKEENDVAETDKLHTNTSTLMGSKTKVFIICFLGIFISFIFFGILQENITKRDYGVEKERFQFTLTLVLLQCVANVVFAKMVTIAWQVPASDAAPTHYYMAMAVAYVGAMLASNDALRFVSYPTQALGKSVKPIPMMVLGVLMARKRYSIQKYFFVLMIVAGVSLFMYKPHKTGPAEGFSVGYGELLLLFSLFLDGFTGGIQERLRGRFPVNAYSMMLRNNTWAVVYLCLGTLLTGELWSFVAFARKYPSVLWQLLLLSLCGSIGQNFIYTTVTRLGPLTCSIITTTRKFFTILVSVLLFGHPLSLLQYCGTALVFTGLALDAVFGKSASKAP